MRRATSSISSFSAAGLALAAIVAAELVLSGGTLCRPWFAGRIEPLPHYKFTSMSRYVFLADCALSACRRDGRPPFVFLGGSPTASLDLPELERRLPGPVAVLAYPPSPYPLELLSLRSTLARLRPAALVLGLGPPSLANYEGPRATRLPYFPPALAALARLPDGAWRYRRLLARQRLANAVAAFRYRFLIQDELFPTLPGRNDRPAQPRRDALFTGASGELALSRAQGLAALDAFFAAWTETGVPLIVWDAPRSSHPSLPGLPIPPEGEAAYLAVMRGLSKAHGFRFIERAEQPRFGLDEYVGVLHLNERGNARLTRYLAAEVAKAVTGSATRR